MGDLICNLFHRHRDISYRSAPAYNISKTDGSVVLRSVCLSSLLQLSTNLFLTLGNFLENKQTHPPISLLSYSLIRLFSSSYNQPGNMYLYASIRRCAVVRYVCLQYYYLYYKKVVAKYMGIETRSIFLCQIVT